MLYYERNNKSVDNNNLQMIKNNNNNQNMNNKFYHKTNNKDNLKFSYPNSALNFNLYLRAFYKRINLISNKFILNSIWHQRIFSKDLAYNLLDSKQNN
jgi:hypothetical protein